MLEKTMAALAFEREALWNRLQAATFLTPNEKRAQLGYEAIAAITVI